MNELVKLLHTSHFEMLAVSNHESNFTNFFDMTKHKYIEQLHALEEKVKELEEKNQLYERIMVNLPIGIQLFDKNGLTLTANDKQLEIFGMNDKQSVIGKFNVLTDPYSIATGAAKVYEKVFQGNRFDRVQEYNFGLAENKWNTRKDSRIFRERIIPFENSKKIIEYVLTIIEDVTERKQFEENLTELNVAKDKLFSIIAHDLRNPINALMGMIEIVLHKLDENDTQSAKRLLKVILNATKNTSNLLENLLHWSCLQTGRIAFDPVQCNFLELVNEVIDFLKIYYSKKSISIHVAVNPNLNLHADYYMLETILRNLISNAIKYSHEKGTIRISAIKTDDYVEVSIGDEGVGISKENLDKLFDDYNYTTLGTDKEKGTGLGLILCKEFVKKHNGEMYVNSEVNKGTTFTFTLKQ